MSNRNLIIKQVKTKRSGKPVTRIDVMTKEELAAEARRKEIIENVRTAIAGALFMTTLVALGMLIG